MRWYYVCPMDFTGRVLYASSQSLDKTAVVSRLRRINPPHCVHEGASIRIDKDPSSINQVVLSDHVPPTGSGRSPIRFSDHWNLHRRKALRIFPTHFVRPRSVPKATFR